MDIENFLKNIRIVDTETTNPKPEDAELIELAVGDFNGAEWIVKTDLYKSIEPIPAEASAINNISNRMIANKPLWKDKIEEILSRVGKDKILVAHNADFDMKVLYLTTMKNYLQKKENWICTYRLSKKCYGDDSTFTQMKMNYLRYRLDLDIPDDSVAHRADTDVKTCAALLLRLIVDLSEKNMIDISGDIGKQLIDLSWEIKPYKVFPFGKHKGKEFKDIPVDYLEWAVKNMDSLNESHEKYDPELAAAVIKQFEERN